MVCSPQHLSLTTNEMKIKKRRQTHHKMTGGLLINGNLKTSIFNVIVTTL